MGRNRTESTGSTKGRKENSGANVERYRKQIAKHDVKKSKSTLKETIAKAQKKENAPHVYKIFIRFMARRLENMLQNSKAAELKITYLGHEFKDIVIMVMALCAVCACVYILFYAVLSETNAK